MEIKDGAKVRITDNGKASTAVIERQTKTLFILEDGRRFRKEDGRETGEGTGVLSTIPTAPVQTPVELHRRRMWLRSRWNRVRIRPKDFDKIEAFLDDLENS